MRIDSHQHFWRVARGDYGWLDAAPDTLRRDFLPDDLAPLCAAAGIDGTVLVQAAPALAETLFMLSLADRDPAIQGVVGWIDVTAPDALRDLAAIAAHPKLVGIRPMLQDIQDTGFILQPAIAPVLDALIERGLCFDALIQPRHLPVITTLAARHPALRLVVDHGAKPRIAEREFTRWADEMAALAAHPSVHCKLSGLLTEAGPDAGAADLEPYAAHLLHCFGPGRLMWGSDWPVLLLASDYAGWHAMARALIPAQLHDAVFGATAAEFYRLHRPAR